MAQFSIIEENKLVVIFFFGSFFKGPVLKMNVLPTVLS